MNICLISYLKNSVMARNSWIKPSLNNLYLLFLLLISGLEKQDRNERELHHTSVFIIDKKLKRLIIFSTSLWIFLMRENYSLPTYRISLYYIILKWIINRFHKYQQIKNNINGHVKQLRTWVQKALCCTFNTCISINKCERTV